MLDAQTRAHSTIAPPSTVMIGGRQRYQLVTYRVSRFVSISDDVRLVFFMKVNALLLNHHWLLIDMGLHLREHAQAIRLNLADSRVCVCVCFCGVCAQTMNGKEKLFQFWLNTRFAELVYIEDESPHPRLILTKSELDKVRAQDETEFCFLSPERSTIPYVSGL